MRPDIYSWGLRVGSLFQVSIRIHWILLLAWLYQLQQHLQIYDQAFGRGAALGAWATFLVLSFGVILIHEFGHCFAARWVGGDAREVLLWPLGGLAFVSYPRNPRNQLIVALGGPATQVVLLLIAWPLFWLLDPYLGELRAESRTSFLLYSSCRWMLIEGNIWLLGFNLVPLYPLDGGRIFQALAWGFQERKGGYGMGPYYRASRLTIWVSVATLASMMIFSLGYLQSATGLALAVWIGMGIYGLHREIHSGDGPESTFGYDFSRGYTSLPGQPAPERRKVRKPGPLARFKERAKERREAKHRISPEEERRLDELLEKISQHGMGAIDTAERDFLEEMSRKKKRLDS